MADGSAVSYSESAGQNPSYILAIWPWSSHIRDSWLQALFIFYFIVFLEKFFILIWVVFTRMNTCIKIHWRSVHFTAFTLYFCLSKGSYARDNFFNDTWLRTITNNFYVSKLNLIKNVRLLSQPLLPLIKMEEKISNLRTCHPDPHWKC